MQGECNSARTSSEVIDAVDPLLMTVQCEIGRGLPDAPHLDCAVQGSARKCVGVLRVEHHLHTKAPSLHVEQILKTGPSLYWRIFHA